MRMDARNPKVLFNLLDEISRKYRVEKDVGQGVADLKVFVENELSNWLDLSQKKSIQTEMIFRIILNGKNKQSEFKLRINTLRDLMSTAIRQKRFNRKRPESLRAQINVFAKYCRACGLPSPSWVNKKIDVFRPAWGVISRYRGLH